MLYQLSYASLKLCRKSGRNTCTEPQRDERNFARRIYGTELKSSTGAGVSQTGAKCKCLRSPWLARSPSERRRRLVLYGHGVGVDGFFASDSFKAHEKTSIVRLVGLNNQPTLLVAVSPGEADEMLLGFGEREKGA